MPAIDGDVYKGAGTFSQEDDEEYEAFHPSYSNFETLNNLCDTFLSLTGQNYPIEKRNEIQKIQGFFKTKMQELSYQNELTPKNAIDFLNECENKFPGDIMYGIVDYSDKYNYREDEHIHFSLKEGQYLRVTGIVKITPVNIAGVLADLKGNRSKTIMGNAIINKLENGESVSVKTRGQEKTVSWNKGSKTFSITALGEKEALSAGKRKTAISFSSDTENTISAKSQRGYKMR